VPVDGPRVALSGPWSGRYRGTAFRDVAFVTVWTVAAGSISDHTDFINMGAWSRQVGRTGKEPE
jgi:hypothetical protein